MSILSQEVRNIISRLPAGVADDTLLYGISVTELPVESITVHPLSEISSDDFFFDVSVDGIVVDHLDGTLGLGVCHG